MMREYQVRICERLGVQFPGPTRQEGADDWAQLVAKRLIEVKAAVPVAGSA